MYDSESTLVTVGVVIVKKFTYHVDTPLVKFSLTQSNLFLFRPE